MLGDEPRQRVCCARFLGPRCKTGLDLFDQRGTQMIHGDPRSRFRGVTVLTAMKRHHVALNGRQLTHCIHGAISRPLTGAAMRRDRDVICAQAILRLLHRDFTAIDGAAVCNDAGDDAKSR